MPEERTSWLDDQPTYISDQDPDINDLLASLLDEIAPGFRERLTGLIRQAYHVGKHRALEVEARDALSDCEELDEGATQAACRALWEASEEYRQEHIQS